MLPETPEVDEDTLRQAVNLAVGGVMHGNSVEGGILRFNGSQVLPPVPGMNQTRFNNLVSRMRDADLNEYGFWMDRQQNFRPSLAPVDPTGEPVTADDIRRWGKFESIGNGRYIVEMGDGYLMSPNGEPYIIDLRSYAKGDPPVRFEPEPMKGPLDSPLLQGLQ